MVPSRQAEVERRWRLLWFLVLITGLVVQLWFWLRSIWIYLDQVRLYELGMAWARDGDLLPVGKLSTGGLPIPGVLLQLVVGGPLDLWPDVRSPTLLLTLFHLTAILILSRVLVSDLGWRITTLYTAVLWLSPWRLFHSGFLWETNFLLLPAALHWVACRGLRTTRVGASVLLGATLMLSFQLHGSAVILVAASSVLLIRRQMKVHWSGLSLGAVVGSITLAPTVFGALRGAFSTLEPEPVAGLLTRLNSVEKGLLYWLRLSSLDVGRRFRQSLFCIEPGAGDLAPSPWLCHLVEVTQILGLASVPIALVATWWILRRTRRPALADADPAAFDWYRQYTLAMLIGVTVSALLSPVLLQGWHVLIALPAACLPVAVWIAYRWPAAGSSLRAIIVLFLLWRIPASLLLLGHPMYARPSSPELPRHIAPVELRELVPAH